MDPNIFSREEVARELAISVRVLTRYESEGLVQAIRIGEVEGYGPTEIRRLWTIVSFQRDLGINLAGVEAILKLRDHMADLHRQLAQVADRLNDVCDARFGEPEDG